MNKNIINVIITTSGLGSRLGDLTNFTNKCLIKIGDKFIINYIIDLYKEFDNVKFYITLGYYGEFVKQFLDLAYPDIHFNYIIIDKYQGIGSSLGYSLLQLKEYINGPFIFHCNDTIIDDINLNNLSGNILYVKKNKNSSNYSSVNVNGDNVIKINNKNELIFDYVYIGVSYIQNYNEFFSYLEKLYNNDKKNSNLSDIHIYMKFVENEINLKYIEPKLWIDTGTSQNLKKANEYYNSKYNVLYKCKESICFMNDKVIKFFYDKEKNLNRINRYKYLKVLSPKILKSTDNFHSMELIDSKPLSEIYNYGHIQKLLSYSLKNIWIKNNCKNFKDICYKFYYEKTIERINMAKKDNLIQDYFIINNLEVCDIDTLIKKVNFDELCNGYSTNFHGDFILDNILYKNNKFYLIDWRENFGKDNLEYGDMYYDLAKLKHNIFFNHKNIEEGLYGLIKTSENSCIVDLKCNFFLIQQLNDYEKFITKYELNKKKINILMSLIWINMAPLHEYPLSNFLFNFGKYNLYIYINNE